MKSILSYLLGLLFFFSTNLYADIDEKIEAIQKAPLEERFKLMNEFKKEILHMQDQERVRAIGKLKSITNSQHSHKAIKEIRQASKKKPVIENRTNYHDKEEKIPKNGKNFLINGIDDDLKVESEDYVESETEEHLENEIEDQVEEETEEHVENEIEDQVEEETEGHIEDEIEDQVEEETEGHIEDEIEDQVEEETEEHIEDEIEDHMEESHDDDD